MPHKLTYISLIVEFIFSLRHMPSAKMPAQDGDGACDVPSVEPLASTSLTCHFNEDLNQTKKSFDVYLNKGLIPEDVPRVFGCTWVSENVNCFVSPGYRFNYAVSRTVTLEIPRASVEHIGTYTCVTGNERKSCDFRVTLAGKTMCDVPSVSLNAPTSLTCYFPEDLSKTKADYTVYHYKNSDNPDEVLGYRWTTNSVNIIPGYEHDDSVTDHLILRIPKAEEEQEGNYSCHTPGVEFGQNCSFMINKVAPTISTCNISSVQKTKPADLTCAFSVDVNVTRKDFRVVRIGGEEIVSCRWRNNHLNCSKSLGYEVNETVTNHFVIKVIAASSEHNGKYVCQIMDAEMECFEPCDFNILMTGDDDNTVTVALSVTLAIVGAIVLAFLVAIFVRLKTTRTNNSENPNIRRIRLETEQELLGDQSGTATATV